MNPRTNRRDREVAERDASRSTDPVATHAAARAVLRGLPEAPA
jgi:hypothetical protein